MFLVSESKLDYTFPSNQFRTNGYNIFRLDHNRFGGGLILYINENIPCKPLQEHVHIPSFEVIAIEFNQNNQKWLPLGLYKPPKKKTSNFVQNLSLILDPFFKKIMIMSQLLEILISPAVMFLLKVFCKHII